MRSLSFSSEAASALVASARSKQRAADEEDTRAPFWKREHRLTRLPAFQKRRVQEVGQCLVTRPSMDSNLPGRERGRYVSLGNRPKLKSVRIGSFRQLAAVNTRAAILKLTIVDGELHVLRRLQSWLDHPNLRPPVSSSVPFEEAGHPHLTRKIRHVHASQS